MSRLAGQFSRIISSSHLYGRLSLSLSLCVRVCVCVCVTVTCLFLFDDGPLLNYQRSNESSQCLTNLFLPLPLLLLISIRPLPLVFRRNSNLVFVSNTNFRTRGIGYNTFLHLTRACLRLIRNKIRERRIVCIRVYTCRVYGRKFERDDNIYFWFNYVVSVSKFHSSL